MGMEEIKFVDQRWESMSWNHGSNGSLNWILLVLLTGLLLLLACREITCKLESCLLPQEVMNGCAESVEVAHLLKQVLRGRLRAGCV